MMWARPPKVECGEGVSSVAGVDAVKPARPQRSAQLFTIDRQFPQTSLQLRHVSRSDPQTSQRSAGGGGGLGVLGLRGSGGVGG